MLMMLDKASCGNDFPVDDAVDAADAVHASGAHADDAGDAADAVHASCAHADDAADADAVAAADIIDAHGTVCAGWYSC